LRLHCYSSYFFLSIFSLFLFFFSLMLPRPPSSPLFPYTTLFRSCCACSQRSSCSSSRARSRARASARGAGADAGLSCSLVTTYRSEEHTSELQSRENLVCRLLLEKKKKHKQIYNNNNRKNND